VCFWIKVNICTSEVTDIRVFSIEMKQPFFNFVNQMSVETDVLHLKLLNSLILK